MPKFMAITEREALPSAAAALRGGEAVVLPTDTVYGVGTLPEHLDMLFALKGRPADVPIAVLVASLAQARGLVEVNAVAERLATTFWPGPLTMVLPRNDGGSTLGVRCPDLEFVRTLAAEVGPLAVTSANRHGEATPEEAAAAAAALAGDVALVLDGGRRAGSASTVVDVTSDALEVLREGPISSGQLKAAALR
jgi:tRNA threonylcarbamoyl adenosine modification protein (Sua5/YciO/YrdC/YwlC family)